MYCCAITGSASIVIHSVKQRLLRNWPGSDAVTSCNFLHERLERAFIRAKQLHCCPVEEAVICKEPGTSALDYWEIIKNIAQGGLSPVLCIHNFAFRFCSSWKMPKRKPERSSDGGDSATKRKCLEDEDEEEGEEEDMEVASGMVCSCLLTSMHM